MTIRVDWAKYTEKQKNAIAGYIRHGIKYKAYIEAYDCENSSKITIQRNCYKFFNTPKIRAIVDQIQQEAVQLANIKIEEAVQGSIDDLVAERVEEEILKIDAFWVLKRAALLADFNVRKFIVTDVQGNAVYDFSTATDDDWYCIQEYTVEEISRGQGDDQYFVDKLRIKTFDKLRALELVGKHIDVQAFKEVSESKTEVTQVTMTSDEYKKARQEMLEDDKC